MAQPQPGHENAQELKTAGMSIYPNPAGNYLTVKYQMTTKEKVKIIVYDISGRQVAHWQPPFEDNSQVCHYPIHFDAVSWANGIYMVEVTNGKETYRTKLAISK